MVAVSELGISRAGGSTRSCYIEAPMVKSRAFQLTSEEARERLDIVTGMYLLHISLFTLIVTYVYMFCYRIVLSKRYISLGTI